MFPVAGDQAVLESSWTHPKAIVRGTRRVGRKGGAREIRSPRVIVLVGVAYAEVHGVARVLLPHSPTHTHTVRQTTVGVGTWVAWGHSERPVGQCTMVLVVIVVVRTGLHYACGRWGGGRGLTALRSFFDFRDLGVHLNGPLTSDSI